MLNKYLFNNFQQILQFKITFKQFNCSLLRTLVPSRPVLVELLPWREGAERRDIIPKLG